MATFRTIISACVLAIPCGVAAAQIPVAAPSNDWKPLPAKFAGGVPFVEVRVGDAKGWFCLDTGAGSWQVDATWATGQGLKVVRGNPRPNELVGRASLESPKFAIGEIESEPGNVPCLDFGDFSEGFKLPIAGLVGSDLFANRIVRIRYGAEAVDVLSSGTPQLPEGSIEIPIAFTTRNRPWTLVLVDPILAPPRGMKALIDTGGARYFSLRPEGAAVLGMASIEFTKSTMRAFGGTRTSMQSTPVRICLGGKQLESGPSSIGGPFDMGECDTMLGSGLLASFDVIFDYAHGRMVLCPPGKGPSSSEAAAPSTPEEPHLVFAPIGELGPIGPSDQGWQDKPAQLVVQSLAPRHVQAGLRLGDILVAINGTDMTGLSVAKGFAVLNEQMTAADTLTLRVKRGDAIVDVTFHRPPEQAKPKP